MNRFDCRPDTSPRKITSGATNSNQIKSLGVLEKQFLPLKWSPSAMSDRSFLLLLQKDINSTGDQSSDRDFYHMNGLGWASNQNVANWHNWKYNSCNIMTIRSFRTMSFQMMAMRIMHTKTVNKQKIHNRHNSNHSKWSDINDINSYG